MTSHPHPPTRRKHGSPQVVPKVAAKGLARLTEAEKTEILQRLGLGFL